MMSPYTINFNHCIALLYSIFANIPHSFLVTFTKSWNATIAFVLSVCVCISPHGTVLLLWYRLSWNLVLEYY
jgi:hypothetical protein